jgi:hypothetical protein
MTTTISVERTVEFRRKGHGGRKELRSAPARPQPALGGRVARVARLLALAIRFQELVRSGAVASYAELARLGQVTDARISQIMDLTLLAPEIQEAILFLPRTEHGRDPIVMRDVLRIAAARDWKNQRRIWARLQTHESLSPPHGPIVAALTLDDGGNPAPTTPCKRRFCAVY